MHIAILAGLGLFLLCLLLSANPTRARKRVALAEADEMEETEFEKFCADLLRYNGFYDVSLTPKSGDQGVDIVAWKDGVKYAIQCKRYQSKLDNTPVQEVHLGRVVYHCQRAAVMTNNYFTEGAQRAAVAGDVDLWDRGVLFNMLCEKERRLAKNAETKQSRKKVLRVVSLVGIAALLLFGVALPRYRSAHPEAKPVLEELLNGEERPSGEALSLGETAELSGLSVTVKQVMFARHCGNLKYLDMAEDGSLYCAVYVDAENTGNKTRPLTEAVTGRAVLWVNGREHYEQEYVQDTEFLYANAGVAPQEKLMNKVVTFKVPMQLQTDGSAMQLVITEPSGRETVWTLR